ncbi:MAG: response regulator transcription factor [Bifidobacteriaceae bacterium]|jgi:DNA-binding response OmpR family regulator|nr:response regulator transcription factor [Bifidobacteriaceae bacterium]
MADILLLTPAPGTLATVLPALDFLPHHVTVLPLDPSVLIDAPASDVVLLDSRRDLTGARATARLLHSTGLSAPLILVVTEGGLTALSAEWGARDFLLSGASPAEVETRIRLALSAAPSSDQEPDSEEISNGDLSIDPVAYTARLRRRPLDLTYKEFELLRYLAQHPGRVFTRAQLLQEVWGYDYFGGTRTVDVHVRRLRAKLGTEYEHLIGTVRNVGYRFNPQHDRRMAAEETPEPVGEPPRSEPVERAPDDEPASVTGPASPWAEVPDEAR